MLMCTMSVTGQRQETSSGSLSLWTNALTTEALLPDGRWFAVDIPECARKGLSRKQPHNIDSLIVDKMTKTLQIRGRKMGQYKDLVIKCVVMLFCLIRVHLGSVF